MKSASALRQLPDLGANATPPALRKDLWAPLFTITLPYAAQGLNAFRMLREYRRLHEISWERPEALDRNYTEEEIEVMQEKLDARGGSKSELVWDIIRREKRKMRVKAVMDQRANSVADLAAVLLEQEKWGMEATKKQTSIEKIERDSEVEEMLASAEEARKGGIEELQQAIDVLRQSLAKPELLQGEATSIRTVKRELAKAKVRLTRMEFAREAVAAAEIDAPTAEEDEAARKAVAEEAASEASAIQSSTNAVHATMAASPRFRHFHANLPSFPVRVRKDKTLPKRGRELQEVRRAALPIYSVEGVTVRWTDILDADYAAQWPERVRHEPMGLTRYTAPRADARAIESIAAFSFVSRLKNAAKMSGRSMPEQPLLAEWVGEDKAEKISLQREKEQKRRAGANDAKADILEEVRRRAEERREQSVTA